MSACSRHKIDSLATSNWITKILHKHVFLNVKPENITIQGHCMYLGRQLSSYEYARHKNHCLYCTTTFKLRLTTARHVYIILVNCIPPSISVMYHLYISLYPSLLSGIQTLSSSCPLVSSRFPWSSVKLLEIWSSWDCSALLSYWSWAFLLLSFSVKPSSSASRSLLPCTSRWRSAIWPVRPSTSSRRDVISCLSLREQKIIARVLIKTHIKMGGQPRASLLVYESEMSI